MRIREARLHVLDFLLVPPESLHGDFPGVLEHVSVGQLLVDLLDLDEAEELLDVDSAGHVLVQDVEDDLAGGVVATLLGLDALLHRRSEGGMRLQESQVGELVILRDFLLLVVHGDLPARRAISAVSHLFCPPLDHLHEAAVNVVLGVVDGGPQLKRDGAVGQKALELCE